MSIRIACLLAILAGCSQHLPETSSAASERENPALLHADSIVRGDLYYFDDCPTCQRLLGTQGDPVRRVYGGRQIRFCRQQCMDTFNAALPARTASLDQRMMTDQMQWYPITTSVVSAQPLSNSSVDFVWGNRLIRVNSDAEKATFLAQPEEYFNRLTHETMVARWPKYPVTKCPVQGRPVEESYDEELAVVIGYRIVRVCCSDCARLVREHPNHYLPIIDLANRMGKVR